jgi:hypothetical protein
LPQTVEINFRMLRAVFDLQRTMGSAQCFKTCTHPENPTIDKPLELFSETKHLYWEIALLKINGSRNM